MRTHSLARLVILGLILGCVSCGDACKQTPEDETRAFESNSAEVKKLMTLYPGFKKPLEAKLTEATKQFESARELSEEAAVVKAMSAANVILTAGFIGQLKSIDGRIKGLKEKMVEVPGLATDEASQQSAKTAVLEAQKTIKDVEDRLEQGAADADAAKVVLEKVHGDLASAEKMLGKVEEIIADKKKAAADAQAAAEEKAAAEEARTAPWACEYCRTSNPHTESECKECGAPRG